MLNKYLMQTECEEIKAWINGVLKNYLEVNPENQGQIEHILDYFAARKRACERRQKGFRIQKMSYEVAKEKAEAWIKTLNKQAKDIVETESDVEVIKNYGNGIRIVKLIGKAAYQREGKLMSHCVASYYGKSSTSIYSLRDAKNNPHCTIEVVENGGRVEQIKGKGNGSIHPKYVSFVLDMLKSLNLSPRKSEMQYLGYRELTDELFGFYSSKLPNFKYITYQGSNFMYIHDL